MMDELSETDRIERDLAATRARMDSRLDELQDHLTPKQMLNDAFAHFRGGEGADFTRDLVARARANPIALALTGVGIAWLMASNARPAAQPYRSPAIRPLRGDDDMAARLRLAEGNVERFDHDDEESYSRRLDEARGKVLGIARDASDSAASYGQRIKGAVATAVQSVRDSSHDLTSAAGKHFQEDTHTMARSNRSTLSGVAANPFALGAIAAIVGAVAGALIPTLDEEEHALGSVATKLRTAGRDLAQDVVDRGGRIATDTLEAVKGSAEAHGLTGDKPIGELVSDVKSGALADHVKQAAQETLQAGKDSAQTHLGSAQPQDG